MNYDQEIADRDAYIRALEGQVHDLRGRLAEAHEDPVTGLPNRRALDQAALRSFARCRRHGLGLAVLVFDIDHFKRVNDTHGHDRGDAVLRCVGLSIRNQVRTSDFAGRYGGEEFVVLVEGATARGARMFAERIRLDVFSSYPAGVEVTLSAGVAVLDGHPDYAALFRQADQALYQAKEGGRDQVVIFGETG